MSPSLADVIFMMDAIGSFNKLAGAWKSGMGSSSSSLGFRVLALSDGKSRHRRGHLRSVFVLGPSVIPKHLKCILYTSL